MAGKFTYLGSARFDKLSPNTLMMPTPWSSTMATLIDSENTSYNTKSSFGTLKPWVSSIIMRPSIFMLSNNSWLMSFTQTLPHKLSASSNLDSNIPMTFGHSFIQFLDNSTLRHTNSNLIVTLNHGLMLKLKQNKSNSKRPDSSYLSSRDVPFSSPHILIYVDFSPIVHSQAPPLISFQVVFVRHSFIQVQTHPFFDRQFMVQTHIQEIACHFSDLTLSNHFFLFVSTIITPLTTLYMMI